jgi:hypothetical protein
VTDGRTALVVVLPQADAVLADFRSRFRPRGTIGEAHVTLLAPFAPADATDAAETDARFALRGDGAV